MSRSIADAPAYLTDTASKERSNQVRFGLPMEVSLWIQVSLLVVGGLIMIYSASSSVALKSISDSAEQFRSTGQYLYKQLFCIFLGLITLVVVRRIPYRLYMSWAPWMLLAAVGALVLVLVPGLGVEINRARRWFHLKVLLLQPAEYAKVAWVVFLSASLCKKQDRIKNIGSGFIPHMFW
ncbi:MAG: FtsW/RodA/SpoVE family cell cycle protein, partial [Syntrophobacteraceae bacterium]|nr:FtsW/RodA/SpoVE family cell cycle protein [Syntrophobacteraceae bacterium]